jgi:hypothetical protein
MAVSTKELYQSHPEQMFCLTVFVKERDIAIVSSTMPSSLISGTMLAISPPRD